VQALRKSIDYYLKRTGVVARAPRELDDLSMAVSFAARRDVAAGRLLEDFARLGFQPEAGLRSYDDRSGLRLQQGKHVAGSEDVSVKNR
jgi:hypothetical protein